LSRQAKFASPVIASDGQSIASGDRRSATSNSSFRRQLSLSTLINSSRINRSNSSVNVDPEDVVMEDVA
jgi:hypothetical protein